MSKTDAYILSTISVDFWRDNGDVLRFDLTISETSRLRDLLEQALDETRNAADGVT